MPRRIALLLFWITIATLPAAAQDDPWTACRRAIAAAEPGSGLPPGLLLSIALVETGRSDPRSGRLEPWPWSWNAGGEPGFAPTREAAIAGVQAQLADGRRSIDIGCMQINLLHHPHAFTGLEQGFDPAANIRYAVGFLKALRARTSDWAAAIAAYHSGDEERGLAYQRRVALARLGAAWASGGTVALPARVTAGLCAPGLRPALVIRRPRAGAVRPRLTCRRPGR
ncbi:MAG TPA: transglycosylase SLT domain-containing protein [Roseomonas sp.]|jgi:hypothetical protein